MNPVDKAIKYLEDRMYMLPDAKEVIEGLRTLQDRQPRRLTRSEDDDHLSRSWDKWVAGQRSFNP
jgi:hypothetical protein